jgi:hypothetical protein
MPASRAFVEANSCVASFGKLLKPMGALAALDDRPRPGKEPTITLEAKAWLVSLACEAIFGVSDRALQ